MTGRTNAVTSPSFSYALDYEQSAVAGAVPRLDGNVSAMRWGSAASTDKAYAYAYDRVGQLQSADYKLLSGGVWSPSANYQEGGLTYDLNGNILSVQRTDSNGENLHELTYTYDGYRLLSVGVNGTASDSYLYDADGNMTFDGRRRLTITYNTLNLPEEIVAGNQKISYIYSASGEKLACDANGSLTYYRSVMVYGSDNKLLYMLTPEGTVSRSEGSAGTSYTYNYFKTDHLGSTRVMLSAVDGTLQASQTTDFYPFGLAFEYSNLNKNKYLFSGKELQDGLVGSSMLEWYDFGARFYDPLLGRWFNMDPAAQYANPYLFCGNSPVMYIDQDGRLAWFIPVIIGAVIGGTMNVISHLDDIHNFWGALGYFGVGAAAGAASAYIGAGVNVAMAGGTFGAGFMGTAAGVSSTGFIAGMVTGASAGIAGGFITGAGNAWLGGANFGDGLLSGVQGGVLGGVTGGLAGGILGGVDALTKGTNFFTGKSSFDLSKAYGASGRPYCKQTVTGKYVGKFEGTNLYESSMMPDGAAATLPGRGIILSKGQFTLNSSTRYTQELLQHEFGHILQAKKVGLDAYYGVIAPESLWSAVKATYGNWNHNTFWTETWANYLSHNYFGAKSLLNTTIWPIQNISIQNAVKFGIYKVYGFSSLQIFKIFY